MSDRAFPLLGSWGPLADTNVYRFTSKEYHANSGLSGYGLRWYDPNLQRWINRDPDGEAGGINFYGFVHSKDSKHSIGAAAQDLIGGRQMGRRALNPLKALKHLS